jgi:hypothetical protein
MFGARLPYFCMLSIMHQLREKQVDFLNSAAHLGSNNLNNFIYVHQKIFIIEFFFVRHV